MMSVAAVPQGARARRHRRRARSTASSSPPSRHLLQTPAVATAIAHELGTDQAAAFDISAACAGFCHGVALASDMVRGGSAKHVLVIGVERLSDLTDLDDRGTAFIFADGAGAAVVGPTDDPGHRPGGVGLRRRAVRPDPAARGLARRDRRRSTRRCRT